MSVIDKKNFKFQQHLVCQYSLRHKEIYCLLFLSIHRWALLYKQIINKDILKQTVIKTKMSVYNFIFIKCLLRGLEYQC